MKDKPSYAGAYLANYDFEATLVSLRHEIVLERIRGRRPSRILEVGCGAESLAARAHQAGMSWRSWIVVEPEDEFIACCRAQAGAVARFVAGRMEDRLAALADEGPFDLIVMAGVLNEVVHPEQLLDAAARLLDVGGLLHVSVPNAYSLHRRLARAMGLIGDEHEPSARNRLLSQARIFDSHALKAMIESHGFRIHESGGHFLKPFTNEQMASLLSLLPSGIIEGLMQLGREMPELAAEIHVDALLNASSKL